MVGAVRQRLRERGYVEVRGIPIVAAAMGDPVGDGLVANLVRPGRNITGLTFLGLELSPKRLELLKHMEPCYAGTRGASCPQPPGPRASTDRGLPRSRSGC